MAQSLKPKQKMDHQDLSSSGFWIGHLMMIVATITGVYLAAQAGLQQAILFDDVSSRQSNYYLRQSLYEEVKDNIAVLRQYDKEFLSARASVKQVQENPPRISRYVWQTMKYSPATLETPSFFLGHIRRFYAEVDHIVAQRESFTYAPSYASELMNKQLDHIENDVLPKLEDNIKDLAEYLKQYDVNVSEINEVNAADHEL